MSEVNILYTFDSKFSKLTAVSVYSLLKHKNKNSVYKIHFMTPPFTHGKKRIKKIAKKFNTQIVWHTVFKSPYKKHDYSRWSPVIFYRLFAYKKIHNIEKILYLDSDTLIFKDLTSLYDTDMSSYVMGGIEDFGQTKVAKQELQQYIKDFIQKYMDNKPYINSGVLLINLTALSKFEQKLLGADIKLKYPDQDLINYVLNNHIKYLPQEYNLIYDGPFLLPDKPNPEDYAIIHCYSVKPYFYEYTPKKLFSTFCELAAEIKLYQDDFLKNDIKYNKNDTKTVIPFIRVTNEGRIKLLFIKY